MRTSLLLLFFSISCFGINQKQIDGIFLDPQNDMEEMEGDESEIEKGPGIAVALMATTPLLNENIYEQKFTTWMPQLLIDFPAGGLTVETGIRASISRLTAAGATGEFAHYFFDLPLRLTATMIMTSRSEIALVLGFIIRGLEFDSRISSEGGWGRSGASANLLGDFGLCMRFKMGKVARLRLDVKTTEMGAGLEFAF